MLLLLYDGAIQYLNKAKMAIEQGDSGQATAIFSLVKNNSRIYEYIRYGKWRFLGSKPI